MNRNVLILMLALAALAGGGWYIWRQFNPEPAQAAELDPRHAEIATRFLDHLDAGAYAAAQIPSSGVRIHRCAANFGQPWCMFDVQQPKLGSSPYRFDSGPLVVHRWSGVMVHCTWLTCWSYWCDHMSGANVAGSALNATRSSRSP